ncbi:MAG: aggregation-promoting factor C-terminal-like domain-containing protein [Nocardioides sp.]
MRRAHHGTSATARAAVHPDGISPWLRSLAVAALAVILAAVVVLAPHRADAAQRAQSVAGYKHWARVHVGARQFPALNAIWMRESGWNPHAQNPTSGAYGIPQALPGRKMAGAGADWSWDGYTQMRWGLHYIKARYGSPVRAWAFWRTHHWY